VRWLSWLAGAMHAHDQTVFYLEQLQPDWLPSRRQRWLVTTGPALTLAVPLTILLFPWFSYATVLGGLMIGVAAWGRTIRPVERLRWTRSGFRRRFLVRSGWGLLIGAAVGIVFDLTANYNEQGVPIHRDFASHLQAIVGSAISWGLIVGGVGAFISRGISPRRVVPNEGIRRSVRRALLVGLVPLLIGIALSIPAMTSGTSVASSDVNSTGHLIVEFIVVIFLGTTLYMLYFLPIMLWVGGRSSLQHLVLRILLVRNKAAPWKYVSFLDEATDRLFLRKVGGGYVFIHRLLLDYFADLQENRAKETTPQAADVLSVHKPQPQ
jgi:eukaryotic-like serine/threonine-protein kinase